MRDDADTPEYRELLKTRSIPMNRKTRRKLAKKAGVSFAAVNHGMVKRAPVYLGIHRFKRAVNIADRREGVNSIELKEQYKSNAWQSLHELEERRAAEAAQTVKPTNAVELSDKTMEKNSAIDT